VREGETIDISGLRLDVLYTPGHTDDSYSFVLGDRVFTGDTLLIRGTGRTDFQNGDPAAQYDSIFNKLLRLPDETLVYPAHDYNGDTVSTIGEERAHSPRLQAGSKQAYIDIMNGLDLPNPKMMDVAVPANRSIGYSQNDPKNSLSPNSAIDLLGKPGTHFVDLRDHGERERDGVIESSIHCPYTDLPRQIDSDGLLREMASAPGAQLVFYCAYGERSALAIAAATESGVDNTIHIAGGIAAWRDAALPLKPGN
ncbi:MAG: rhodanese-like domain-containing protein, partial [Pseudomonadota bacterium]